MTKSRESTDDKQESTHNYNTHPHTHTDPFQWWLADRTQYFHYWEIQGHLHTSWLWSSNQAGSQAQSRNGNRILSTEVYKVNRQDKMRGAAHAQGRGAGVGEDAAARVAGKKSSMCQ